MSSHLSDICFLKIFYCPTYHSQMLPRSDKRRKSCHYTIQNASQWPTSLWLILAASRVSRLCSEPYASISSSSGIVLHTMFNFTNGVSFMRPKVGVTQSRVVPYLDGQLHCWQRRWRDHRQSTPLAYLSHEHRLMRYCVNIQSPVSLGSRRPAGRLRNSYLTNTPCAGTRACLSGRLR